MIQKNKQLLLKDLCARQPYGVKVQYNNKVYAIDYVSTEYEEVKLNILDNYTVGISDIKPYLRQMSSMTEEEVKEFYDVECIDAKVAYIKPTLNWHFTINGIDWLNAHHLDYRGLIPMGLAIEVNKENNPYEEINL